MWNFSSRIQTILSGIIAHKTLANAYLFSGPPTALLDEAAQFFAMGINCLAFNAGPCGNCGPCHGIQNHTFIDVREITPDTAIKIEDIKTLQASTKYGPNQGNKLVVLVYDAEKLTDQAANAFLKTLEEPHDDVIFILITTNPVGLLPTIRSRCQEIDIPSAALGTQAAPVEGHVPFQNFMQLSAVEKLQLATTWTQDKAAFPEFLSLWIEELWANPRSASSTDLKNIELIIEILGQFRYNLNSRLHLENLFLRLQSAGIGKK